MAQTGEALLRKVFGARLRPPSSRPYPRRPIAALCLPGMTLTESLLLSGPQGPMRTGTLASLPSGLRHELAGSWRGCGVPERGHHPKPAYRGTLLEVQALSEAGYREVAAGLGVPSEGLSGTSWATHRLYRPPRPSIFC